VGLIWLSRIAAAVLLALLVLLAREAATHSIDFPVYHRAARQVLDGNYELYPPEAYGGRPFPSQGFRYAPAVAVLFVPFGWLPLELAALVFFALKLAALWYVGATVARHVGLSGRRRQVLLVAFLVVGGYVVEELRFGNAHFFCITLMVFAYDRVESGHVLMPAVALAVAIAMKVTPLALLAYFAIRRRWSLCLSTIAILCLLVVLPGAVIGSAQNARQLRAFATYAMEKIEEDDNYSLRGALVRYLTPGHADISHVDASVADLSSTAVNGIWLLGLVGLGLAALAALWREVDDPVARLLEFCIVLTGIVLASPHTQRRYFVALYVPAVALVALLARTPPADQKRLMRIGLLAKAAPATILPLVFGGRRLALLYEASSPYFFGALVLFGALVMLTVRRKAGHVDTAHVRDEYVNPIALPMMGDQ
jgi:Glycosyltransferase family 87